eukprot:11889230-Prorocentrum_lima.AAC.1
MAIKPRLMAAWLSIIKGHALEFKKEREALGELAEQELGLAETDIIYQMEAPKGVIEAVASVQAHF